MISVHEALQIILQNTQDFGVEEVPFLESVGRVLKEDIVADRDFPPFNRVSMDGIAINHRFFEHGVRDFKIEGIQPAGSPQETLENAAHCYEVMTGAVLPENADTVIQRWQQLSTQLGRRIELIHNKERFAGNCIGIDPDKGLIIQLDTGFVRIFDSAHTTIVKS